jgi:hypothetical protein
VLITKTPPEVIWIAMEHGETGTATSVLYSGSATVTVAEGYRDVLGIG